MFHKAVTNLLFNYRLQPLLLHKIYHVIKHFHAGHAMEHKTIMRKPANFKYFWLWWLARPQGRMRQAYEYDRWLCTRKIATGEVKAGVHMQLFCKRDLMNAF